MRHKRAKAYRKLMTMYQDSFGFHQPYQVLVDASFCQEGTKTKLLTPKDAVRFIGDLVQGSCKLMITQCCIIELYSLGSAGQAIVDLAKSFERRKCNHREAISGEECVAAVVGPSNKHRYVVASQSTDLRNKLREIPAIPLIHINRSVLVLEPPSKATVEHKQTTEESALHPLPLEVPSTTDDRQTPKKRRGPKGPNPLSVKKAKPKMSLRSLPTKLSVSSNEPQSGDKRKRSGDQEESGAGAVEGEGDIIEGQRQTKKRKRRKASSKANPDDP